MCSSFILFIFNLNIKINKKKITKQIMRLFFAKNKNTKKETKINIYSSCKYFFLFVLLISKWWAKQTVNKKIIPKRTPKENKTQTTNTHNLNQIRYRNKLNILVKKKQRKSLRKHSNQVLFQNSNTFSDQTHLHKIQNYYLFF